MRSLIRQPTLAPASWTPRELLESPDRSPMGVQDALGVTQASSAYGSDAKTAMDLIGLTANENPLMFAPQRFYVYDEMVREDAAVKSLTWLYQLPIRSAVYTVTSASDDPADRMVADAVRWQFGLEGKPGVLDLSWHEQVQQMCLMLRYGCMFEEVIVGDIDIWYDGDGDPHPMRPFSRFMPIFPQTIRMPDGIDTDQRTGQISVLRQALPGTRPIPGMKIVPYVLDREGHDWLGTSLLRPMYGSWKLKKAVMVSAGIGWDRFAFGTPIIRYPKNGGPAKKAEAESIGRNWRTHERGYFVLEGAAGTDDSFDISIEGAGEMQDPTNLIHTYDEQIAAAGLAHFVVLGRTSTGSRAVGDALAEPYYLALQAVADDLMTTTQRRKIRLFVDLNFGEQYDTPTIMVSKLQARNVAVLAAAITALSDAGLSFTDPDTQNDLRDMLDLRHLPEDAQRAAQDAIEAGAGLEGTATGGPAAAAAGVSPRVPTRGQTGDGRDAAALAEGTGLGY